MTLTPEEMAELQALEGQGYTGEARAGSAPADFIGPPALTDEEQRELAELERQENLDAINSVYEPVRDFLGAAAKPVGRALKIQREQAEEGLNLMGLAWNEPGLKNIGMGALGALQYAWSPITGAAEGLIGEPTQAGLEAAGVQPGTAEFISRFPTEAVQMIPGGAAVGMANKARLARKGAVEMLDAAKQGRKIMAPGAEAVSRDVHKIHSMEEIQKTIELTGQAPMLPQFTMKGAIPKSLEKEFRHLGKSVSPKMGEQLTNEIALGADEFLAGNYQKSERLFKNVANGLDGLDIQIEDLPDILQRTGMNTKEFAQFYMETYSQAGRQLQQLSALRKRLNKVFADEPEALAMFNKMADSAPKKFSLGQLWWQVENYRRGLLVTQVGTAMRNNFSQAGRVTIGAIDKAFESGIKELAEGGSPLASLKAAYDSTTEAMAVYNRFSPKGRQRLIDIFESEGGAMAAAKLFSSPVHEVTTGSKLMKFLQGLNRFQEYQYRNIGFETHLRHSLKKAGKDLSTINPNHIPKQMLDDAAEYGLEMSFARNPKGATKKLVDGWNAVLTPVHPFPRFAFANAIPFIFEHSPLGLTRLMGDDVIRELASGDATKFARIASRAATGTAALYPAWQLRQSDWAGEKWHEIKIPADQVQNLPDFAKKLLRGEGDNLYIDTRGYAPLNFPLFIAEMFLHPERITLKDKAEVFIGLQRTGGSALALLDLLKGGSRENDEKVVSKVIGQHLGSFSVPFRTPQDLMGIGAGGKTEDSIRRDIRDNPISGPFLRNIPWALRLLPEARNITTTERQRSKLPAIRQLLGLSVTVKNRAQQEIDRLGLSYSQLYPQTGILEADRYLEKQMGPIMQAAVPRLLDSPQYKNLSDAGKKIAFKELVTEVKRESRAKMNIERNDLHLASTIKGYGRDMVDYMKEHPEEWERVRALIGDVLE